MKASTITSRATDSARADAHGEGHPWRHRLVWWGVVPVLAVVVLFAVTYVTSVDLAEGDTDERGGEPRSEPPSAAGSDALGFPRTIATAHGTLELTAPPQRIVSCVPAADEMLAELVDASRLWAVTHNAAASRWSFARETLEAIPPERRIRFVAEQSDEIVRWQPDLVVVGGFTEARFRQRMHHAGIPVLKLRSPDSLEAIQANLRLLAQATGAEDAGEALLASMQRRLETLQERIAQHPPTDALYLAYYGEELSTVGEGSTIDVQLALAGYENLGRHKLSGPWGPIAFEHIAELDRRRGIDVLLFPRAEPVNDTRDPERIPHAERFRALPGASLLSPLASDPPRVLEIPQAYVQTSSHHILEGVAWLVAQREKD